MADHPLPTAQEVRADQFLEQLDALLTNFPMKPCSRCRAKGYHHGFGEDGCDPDWCEECGGATMVGDEDEYHRKRRELVAALLLEQRAEARRFDGDTIAGAHLSDKEVADKVRMLMRTDLDHEAVCTMARDRIMYLSRQRADARAISRDGKYPCGGSADLLCHAPSRASAPPLQQTYAVKRWRSAPRSQTALPIFTTRRKLPTRTAVRTPRNSPPHPPPPSRGGRERRIECVRYGRFSALRPYMRKP